MYLKNPEVSRKIVHLTSLIMPITYYFTTKNFMTLFIGLLFLIITLWEVARLKLNFLLLRKFNNLLLRGKEAKRLSGGFFFILACLLAVIFFSKYLFIISVSVLIISDTVAAYIGINFGKHKILDKSLEGSLGFFASGLIVITAVNYLFLMPLWSFQAILALLVTTGLELLANFIKIDDNLLIVIGFAATYMLI